MNSSLPLAFGMSKHDLKPVDTEQLTAKTYREALATCIDLSKYKHNKALLAADLDMPASQLSKCLSGSFHFPGDKVPILERLCGNTAVTQWFALQHGATLKVKTLEEKLAECEAKLAKYEQVAA